MTRETKLGLVVASSFVALRTLVIVSRLKQAPAPPAATPPPLAAKESTATRQAQEDKPAPPVSTPAPGLQRGHGAGGAGTPQPMSPIVRALATEMGRTGESGGLAGGSNS